MSVDVKIQIQLAAKQAEVASKRLENKLGNLEKRMGRASRAFDSFIGNLAAQTAFRAISAIGSAMADTVRNAREYETALVGVGKTTNLAGKELEALGEDFVNLSKTIPVSTTELLELGKTAAQLGVKGNKDLLKFTETMARLQTATNIAGEEGAISMARLLNVTSTGIQDVDKVGSTLVDLGNNFELLEGELLKTATSIGQATAQFGLGATDVLALGTALKSFGIQAELAGTNTGIIFKKMSNAVANGGSELKNFAQAAGVSSEEFSKAFRDKPIKAFQLFSKGLSDAQLTSEQMTQTLQRLGLNNQRVSRVINAVVTGYDKYESAVSRANDAIKTNTALMDESNAVFETTDSKLQRLDNSWFNLTRTIGIFLKPFVDGSADETAIFVNDLADGLNRLKLGESAREMAELNKQIERQERSVSDTKDRIKEYQAQLDGTVDQDLVTRLFSDPESRLGGAQRDLAAIIVKLDEYKKARNALLGLGEGEEAAPVDLGKALGPELTTEAAKTAAIANELQRRKDLLIAFDQDEFFRQQTLQENQAAADGLFKNETFLRIQETLGTERALKLAAKVSELNDEGKHAQALEKIRKVDLEAQKKITAEQKKEEDQRIQNRSAALSQIASLSSSSSSTLAAIGKVAAATQIGIDTEAAASSAYKWGTGIGGPFLGSVFQGLAYAAGAVKISNLNRYQEGGVVPGNSFSGDTQLARVNSGEMILNREQQSRLFDQANGAGGGGQQPQDINTHITVELDGDVVAKTVSRKVADGLVLGENV